MNSNLTKYGSYEESILHALTCLFVYFSRAAKFMFWKKDSVETKQADHADEMIRRDSEPIDPSQIIGDQNFNKYEEFESTKPKVVKRLYVTADGRTVEYSQDEVLKLTELDDGPIIGSYPQQDWVSGNKSELLQSQFIDEVDDHFFDKWRTLNNQKQIFYPGSAVAFMDPLGIMSPASIAPIKDHERL